MAQSLRLKLLTNSTKPEKGEAMKTKLFITAILGVFALANVALAQRGPRESISGRWEGEWHNSHGSDGYDVLEVREFGSGQIQGLWGTRGYEIQGRRAGPNRYVWQAHGRGRHYDATARLLGRDRLRIDYTSTYRERGEVRTYRGVSELWRVD
jgi:hypothetical protein